MKRGFCGLLAGLFALCGVSHADVTFEIICRGGACAVSADGSVVVGNTEATYETFRWTEEGGRVLLGMATVPVIGVGAGLPDVSADGTRVSATILTADSAHATQGLWVEGQGWRQLMPPTPPDGGTMDYSYGSAWGISEDGETVVGLYWRPGQPDGSAHASAWRESTGVVDLGSAGRDSRANDANEDGSVIVGWTANPEGGAWDPTVWVNGDMTVLRSQSAFCEASAVTPDGTMLVGQAYDESTGVFIGAAWRWNGSAWEEEWLGALPGTFPYYGNVYPHDVTADGSMIVGYNAFDWNQSTGFIWTEETGIVDVKDFLTENGVTVDPTFNIQNLTGVSDDGTVLVGTGQNTFHPYAIRSFIIRIIDEGGIPDPAQTPQEPALMHVLTNPTKSPVTLMLHLPRNSETSLDVYDITGRLVRRLLNGAVSPGDHEVHWDGMDNAGSAVAPGVYVVRVDVDGGSESSKIMLLR